MRLRLINLAIEEALKSHMGMRHGAIVLDRKSGKVISRSCNRLGSMRGAPAKSMSVHAEVAALSNCNFPGEKVVLVVRVSKKGEPVLSKPCPNCMRVMRFRGVCCCHYSAEDGSIVRENIL
jgi:tRNA(Arg) A34 adenosine deaminase TadA